MHNLNVLRNTNTNADLFDSIGQFEKEMCSLKSKEEMKATSQQKKVFDTWFRTGNDDYDRERLSRYLKGVKEKKDAINYGVRMHTDRVDEIFLYSAMLLSRDNGWYTESVLFHEMLGTSTEAMFSYCHKLTSFSFREDLMDFIPSENVALKKSFENYFGKAEEGSTCGYTPYGFLEVLTCVASLIAVEEDSIIKKAVKKAVETNLNELLNIENYKVIGIKTLSRTMELLYSINQFKDINDLDKGICALVFLLLCLDNPSDVAVYSCYAEYIMRNEIAVNKGLDERDEKKSEIIDFIQEGSISLVEELEYIKNHSDSFKTRLKQDDLMTSMFLYKRFNVYSHIDMIETLIRNNKDDILACILYKYPVDTWEKLPIENRAWIVYKTTIGDQIINDAGSCMEWFPYAKENEKTELSECDTEEIVERVMKEYKCEKSKAVSDKTPFEFSEENDKKQKEAINQLQRESNLLRTQLKEIRMENHKLNTELNQIQSEKDSEKLSQEERQELNRLREFVFRLKSEEDSMDDKSIDEKVIRNAGTIVLIGGHTTLYRKLIDKYENIRCIDGRKRVSFDMIHDASYVFFLFDFMSHGSYYQGCRECSKVNVPYGYIQGTNLEKAEKQMIEAIKEFDKA